MDKKDDGLWGFDGLSALIGILLIFCLATLVFSGWNYLTVPPLKGQYPNIEATEKTCCDYDHSRKIAQDSSLLQTNKDSVQLPSNQDKNSSEEQNVPTGNSVDTRDLFAQEGMWRATNAVVLVSVAQAVSGILALALLIWTLSETRRTADAAVRTAEAAEAAESAYVLLEFDPEFCGKVPPIICDEELKGVWLKKRIRIKAAFTNYGKTPAKNFSATLVYDESRVGEGVEARSRANKEFRPSMIFNEFGNIYKSNEGSPGFCYRTVGDNTVPPAEPFRLGDPYEFWSIQDIDYTGRWPVTTVAYGMWSYANIFGGNQICEFVEFKIQLDYSQIAIDGLKDEDILRPLNSVNVVRRNIEDRKNDT